MIERNSALSPNHRTLLNVAHRNSLRLLRLVDTLLDFSRVEAGRIRVSFESVDLSALTAELASNFRSACERAGLRLEVDCLSLGQPWSTGHVGEDRLNFVSNAFKFTLEGCISGKVRPEGDHAMLLVKDTGVGIPEPEFPISSKIPSCRRAAAKHEGTGIGLSLVQELVRLHRGAIQGESNVGQGTTFTVSLPFGFDHLPSDHIRPSSPLPYTTIGANAFIEEAMRWLPSSQASNVSETILDDAPFRANEVPNAGPMSRVLVADDNADMRDYMRRLSPQTTR